MISDAHEGIKAAVARVLSTGWQHCRTHFVRNMRDHAARSGRRLIAAAIGTAFAEETSEAAHREWRRVSDRLRPNLPKLSQRMDEAEMDVLAYKRFPPQHWPKIGSTDEIDKRHCDFGDTLGLRRRPRGEARRIGCKCRRAAHGCPADLRRLRTDRA